MFNTLFHQRREINRAVESLTDFSIFSAPEIDRLSHYLHLRSYETDDLIFSQGTEAIGCYFIVSGSTSLHMLDEDGSEDRLRMVLRGEGFGFTALFSRAQHFCSARALEPVKMLVLTRPDLSRLCIDYPLLANKILERAITLLSKELNRIYQDYYQLTHKLTRSNIII